MRFVKVEIELDQTLLDEVMQRYHMRSPREAVNLALRSALVVDSETDDEEEDENDPFGLAALDPHRHHRDAG
jgi:Arc/MetJ family transcription regulator